MAASQSLEIADLAEAVEAELTVLGLHAQLLRYLLQQQQQRASRRRRRKGKRGKRGPGR